MMATLPQKALQAASQLGMDPTELLSGCGELGHCLHVAGTTDIWLWSSEHLERAFGLARATGLPPSPPRKAHRSAPALDTRTPTQVYTQHRHPIGRR